MKAILLCGGQGMRMGGGDTPKPLMSIGDKPVLWHIMKHLSLFDIDTNILALGYKQDLFKDYFVNKKHLENDFVLTREGSVLSLGKRDVEDLGMELIDTGKDTKTAGRIFQLKNRIAGEDKFLVCYGDVIANVNIAELIKVSEETDSLCTITAHRAQSRFGILDVDFDSRVLAINEKPMNHDFINIGFMVIKKEFFDLIPDLLDGNVDKSLEADILPLLAEANNLSYYEHKGFYHPMDNWKEYVALKTMWEEGKAPWKTW